MEKWKKIDNYPNYSISNKARVRNDTTNRILKSPLSGNSVKYYAVNLHNVDGQKTWNVHRLVYQGFNGRLLADHVIDHKDDDSLNNVPENLQQITNRDNVYKHLTNKGVIWDKSRKKWLARIRHKGKSIYLGRHAKMSDALEVYKNKLKEIVK